MKQLLIVLTLALFPVPVLLAQPVVVCDGLNCTMTQSNFERLVALVVEQNKEIIRLREENGRCRM